MNQDGGTGDGGHVRLDPALAAALIDQEAAKVRRALDVGMPLQLFAWGTAWLAGLGGMWLDVRNQHPYVGARAPAAVVFVALLVAAGALTAYLSHRGTRGLGGESARRGMLFGWLWGGGFGGLMAITTALAQLQADAGVLTVVGTCGAVLITGLVYLAGAGFWGSRPMQALGIWMVAIAAVAGFFGPVGVLAVAAVAGGGGLIGLGLWMVLAGRR